MRIMEKSLKTALDKALDDIFKGWKWNVRQPVSANDEPQHGERWNGLPHIFRYRPSVGVRNALPQTAAQTVFWNETII